MSQIICAAILEAILLNGLYICQVAYIIEIHTSILLIAAQSVCIVAAPLKTLNKYYALCYGPVSTC